MRNLRKVEDNFFLSGGWEQIVIDVERLRTNKIVAVLDVQYTPMDELDSTLPDLLKKNDIEYKRTLMYDGEYNQDIQGILDDTQEWLAYVESRLKPKKEFILVKCGVGVSRSAMVLINYLCMSRRLTFSEALTNLRNNEEKGAWLSMMEWPISMDPSFQYVLKKRYPDYDSAFGEKV